ncbi:hypothetical protein ABFS82_04G015100 [Erythranthe guttata]|uniref:Peptidase A1 domain-containing protein n=2 Tax=Erythranthe guttata TaxID=4155 RepID=A0A022S2Z9_ERYGU|nr:hypothetical protein MIMGU_mgv1a024909mg [Erythranthe guttata]
MAKTQTLLLLYFLSTLILVLNKALVNSNGLTLTLIHPHSPKSPFFQGNLSFKERIKKSVSQSKIRGNYLARTSLSTIQTQITAQSFHYKVKVGIGTFKSKPPYKEYYLDIDTGSSLVWMQCDGCTRCFKQTPKPFPKQNSSSFRPILVQNKPKPYEYEYEDGSTTNGILAREAFYLTSKNGGLAKIENIEFGCGLDNNLDALNWRNNKVAGIMGLGWEDTSFVKQVGPQIKGIFSYCLPVLTSKTPSTYLRFGNDIVHQENSKSTPIYMKHKDSSPYYVDLQGITVNRTRLNISPRVFDFKSNGNLGGCTIDSGTPFSRIVGPAFDILKTELEKYFSRFRNLKKIKGNLDLDLCYERSKPEKYNNLPEVTFHLRGADFVMKAEAVFQVVGRSITRLREYFCLAMVPHSTDSTIGSHQQTNHRLIHDTKNKKLVFYPVDCAKNP